MASLSCRGRCKQTKCASFLVSRDIVLVAINFKIMRAAHAGADHVQFRRFHCLLWQSSRAPTSLICAVCFNGKISALQRNCNSLTLMSSVVALQETCFQVLRRECPPSDPSNPSQVSAELWPICRPLMHHCSSYSALLTIALGCVRCSAMSAHRSTQTYALVSKSTGVSH